MSRTRDRAVLALAVFLVATTAGMVLWTVQQAKREGTRALEKLQVAQVEQLTRSMESRIQSTFDAFAGIVSAPPAWTARLRDPAEAQRLAQFQALNPKARTGFLIVDAKGVVTNGTLLRDPATVGRPLVRPGLDGVLQGEPAILPVAPGVTTALPTLAIAYPLKDAGGTVIGAFIVESDVSAESAFSEEVAGLKRGRTGEFSFIDSAGVVVASSNPSLLARKLDEPLLDSDRAGFLRGGDRVAVTASVPAAGWRTVFRQDAEEFEGSLTGPLDSALLLVMVAGAIGAVVSFVLLGRRLRRAREEQRRLEEISAVREEFISIVSHELRTPVAGLLGFLQTTLDHWDGMADDERRRALGRSLASARRLHSLTRDVLDTSTMESGAMLYSFSVVDLRDEVDSALVAAEELAPGRAVRADIPSEPVPVRIDPERVQQVLTNLVDNALKSSPPGTPVEIGVRVADGEAHVSVTDHGPGLSDVELGRVFDKFVRGRTATTSGTGLGLYICRQIVEAHGGTIRAQSGGNGGGASFVFTLPLSDVRAEPVVV